MMLSKLLLEASPLRTPAIPRLNRVESACERVLRRWPDVVAAPISDRETIIREMRRRIRDRNWEGATLAEVIRAARVAFEPDFRRRWNLKLVRRFFFAETRVSSRRAFLGAMISIYLGTYKPAAPHTKSLARALVESQSPLGRRWSKLLDNLPKVLDPFDAAAIIGRMMRNMIDPWNELKKLGFQDPHAPGLLHHAHLAYVSEMRPALRTLEGATRMLTWLKPDQREARSAGAAEAIDALLDPWISDEPPEDIRTRLIDTLVTAYGDPRVRSGGVWATVGDQGRQVMLRWLTGANINFFLDVVSEVETSHMWQPRREFWWGLYEEGLIDAAWAAFSARAAATADRMTRAKASPSMLTYGKQTAGGSRGNTSLLILKIGNHVVVEGSHSYKVHVFRSDDRFAPKLFLEAYDCERIRLSPGHREQIHHAGWQDRIRILIGC